MCRTAWGLGMAGLLTVLAALLSGQTSAQQERPSKPRVFVLDDVVLTPDLVISVPTPQEAEVRVTALDSKTKEPLEHGRLRMQPFSQLFGFEQPLKWGGGLERKEPVDLLVEAHVGGRQVPVQRATTVLAQLPPQQVAAVVSTGSKELGIYPEKFEPATDRAVLFAYYVGKRCWVLLQVRDASTTTGKVVWEREEGDRSRGASTVSWDGTVKNSLLPAGHYLLTMKVWWHVPNRPWKPNPLRPDYRLDADFELIR